MSGSIPSFLENTTVLLALLAALLAGLLAAVWLVLRWKRQARRIFTRKWETAPAPVLVHRGGVILYANPAFKRLSVLNDGLAVGENWLARIQPDERERLASRYAQVIESGLPARETYSVTAPGQMQPRQWSSSLLPMIWEGRPAVLEVFHDPGAGEEKPPSEIAVEQYFRKLFADLPFSICLSTRGGRLIAANASCAALFGYSNPDQMLAESGGRLADLAQTGLETDESGASERLSTVRWFRRRDGSQFAGRVVRQCYVDEQGQEFCLEMIEDLSESQRVQQALKESEKRFERLFDSSDLAIFESSLDGRLLRVNQAYADLHGYQSPQEVLAEIKDVANQIYVHPEKRQEVLQEALKTGEMICFENESWRKDGSIFLGSIKLQVMFREDGQPDYIFGFVEDITQRKQFEAALQASEESYRGLFNSVREAIYIQGRDLRFLDVNQGAVEMYGYPREAFLGQTPEFVSAPGRNNLAEIAARVEQAFQKIPQRFEFWGMRANGEIFPKDVRLYPGVYFGREVVIAIAIDITEQKRAQEALAEMQNDLEIAQKAAGIGSWRWDLTANRVWWSPQLYTIWGREPGEELIPSEAWLGQMNPDDAELLLRHLQKSALEKENLSLELRIRRWSDGEERLVQVEGAVIFDENDLPIRMVGTMMDITERRMAELKIQQLNQELETRVFERTAQLETAVKELEAFSYSVSHDLRAPLRAMDGYSKLLMTDFADKIDDRARNYLERIRVSSQRMAQLIDDLLMLSRISRRELLKRKTDLSKIAVNLLTELETQFPDRRVEWQVQPDMVVQADENLLSIALRNLLENSWKFTAPKASAQIEVGCLDHEDHHRVYYVRDNGVGFDMTYAENMFAPFQRLHPQSQFEGTGIGLAIVQRIIRKHGGWIWAESILDQGTTMFFVLEPTAGESI